MVVESECWRRSVSGDGDGDGIGWLLDDHRSGQDRQSLRIHILTHQMLRGER